MGIDGSIVAEGTPREFFSGNSFYTTPANRMARHLLPQAVTVIFILIAAEPMLEKLDRIKVKYGLVE